MSIDRSTALLTVCAVAVACGSARRPPAEATLTEEAVPAIPMPAAQPPKIESRAQVDVGANVVERIDGITLGVTIVRPARGREPARAEMWVERRPDVTVEADGTRITEDSTVFPLEVGTVFGLGPSRWRVAAIRHHDLPPNMTGSNGSVHLVRQ